jgi:hypothetical protein
MITGRLRTSITNAMKSLPMNANNNIKKFWVRPELGIEPPLGADCLPGLY